MKIGELSRETGVPARLLRYYEEQDLLRPERGPNGYRRYAPADVGRVGQLRELLEAGLPTEAIRELLPCLDTGQPIRTLRPEVRARLQSHLERMERRIACLCRNRDALATYLGTRG